MIRGEGVIVELATADLAVETGGVSVSTKKLPVVRDEDMESLYGVSIESVSAFYNEESGNLVVVGELAASNGVLEDEYREVQVVIHDAEGDIVGRGLDNWMSFGLRQSFELSFNEADDLHGTPSSVTVFPASSFPVTAAAQDSDFLDSEENPYREQGPSFAPGCATVDHERLASIAEFYSSCARGIDACAQVSLSFISDDPGEVARLLDVPLSCLSHSSCLSQPDEPDCGGLYLHGDMQADTNLTGQIAALLSRTTDDLDAWRELAEDHFVSVSVTITTSGLEGVGLNSVIVLAMAERKLSLDGFTICV